MRKCDEWSWGTNGWAAIEKKDSKIKINQSGNKKYYLPAGKYTIELENNGKKEAQNLDITEKNQMR